MKIENAFVEDAVFPEEKCLGDYGLLRVEGVGTGAVGEQRD